MRPLTQSEQRTMVEMQRALVYKGWHPAIAGKIVRLAAERALRASESGLGKVHQARSLRRDLDPTIPPRLQVSGERCVRIQEIPGNETTLYRQLEDYRNRGWNVMEVEKTKGFPSVRVFWACPPGVVPMEAQTEVLQSEPWGAPLYVRGLGQEQILTSLKQAGQSAPITAVREAVSPWLWTLSIVSFLKGFFGK